VLVSQWSVLGFYSCNIPHYNIITLHQYRPFEHFSSTFSTANNPWPPCDTGSRRFMTRDAVNKYKFPILLEKIQAPLWIRWKSKKIENFKHGNLSNTTYTMDHHVWDTDLLQVVRTDTNHGGLNCFKFVTSYLDMWLGLFLHQMMVLNRRCL
jgi:hypothetical protein